MKINKKSKVSSLNALKELQLLLSDAEKEQCKIENEKREAQLKKFEEVNKSLEQKYL